MAWIRIDDHFDEHPKLAQVGPLGWGVWLAGLAYCNRNLTDGFIPWSKARLLASFSVVEPDGRLWELSRTSGLAGEDVTTDWVISLLLEVGLWEEIVSDTGRIEGYQIHDYEEYQPLKADVEAEREHKRRAGQAGGRARAQAAAEQRASTEQAEPKQSAKQNPSRSQAESKPKPNPNPKSTERSHERSAALVPVDEPEDDAVVEPVTLPSRNETWALIVDVFAVTGMDASEMTRPERNKQGAVARRLLRASSPADIVTCARWLWSQPFHRERGIDLLLIESQLTRWKTLGKPREAPAQRSGTSGPVRPVPAYYRDFPDDLHGKETA